ncbi:uncharacterized protein C6orf132 homolog [Struthio camelus]|uniref:uncharacterized protein C6orf132 homolog n=1 Tax=Struthio camelus TaxID=8801 RepID=UPI003603F450
MKKHHPPHHSVQGTFSRLFGRKHAQGAAAASLFATNPPWIFAQEVTSESAGGTGDVIEVYYGDNRFGTMTDSGTATLKPRPRVRPLLTFLPLNAQESHGVAVPTPSVPEDFEEKGALGSSSQMNGNYRLYSSVGDLRPQASEGEYLDEDIPPPPSVPPPPPPAPASPPPPPPMAPVTPTPPKIVVPPPPAMAPPLPPASASSSPGTPAPPDFIPPAPPAAPFSASISKWKSETVLNTRQADAEGPVRPTETGVPAVPGQESLQPKPCPEPHLTFPRSFKVPPPAPARSSSIPVQEPDALAKEEPFPKQPRTRPPLPPCFTIRPAAKVHATGDAEQKSAVLRKPIAKPAVPVTQPPSPRPGLAPGRGTNSADRQPLPPDSNSEKVPQPKKGENDSSPKSEILTANDLDLPPPDYPSLDEDWKEASNLNRLKHELVALLSSSKREERQVDRPVIPQPVNSVTDCAGSDRISSDRSKLTKPVGKDSRLPKGGESEKREICISTASAKESSSNAVLPAPENKPTNLQLNSVMKIRNELEAMLSLKKEGKPSLGLGSQKQSLENCSGSICSGTGHDEPGGSLLPKPVPGQVQPLAAAVEDEKVQEDHQVPAAPSASDALEYVNPVPKPMSPSSSLNTSNQPQKPKDELPVLASPLPSSPEMLSPMQSSAPQSDVSLFQYKTHRARADLTDQLGAASSDENSDGKGVGLHPAESTPVPSEPLGSLRVGQDDVLIHPVTGEKVEKGSPMALLLAAKQRAQRGRHTPSRQGSNMGEKPQVKVPQKPNSAVLEMASTSFYRDESKPYSFTVVPRSPRTAVLGQTGDGLSKTSSTVAGSATGLAGSGQRQSKPPSFSSSSEQSWTAQKPSKEDPESFLRHRRAATSNLVQGLLESSQPKHPDLPNSSAPLPCGLASNKEEKNGEIMDYEIIPPPPEFSNNVDDAEDASLNREASHKCPTFPDYSPTLETPQYFRWPSHGYRRNYDLPSQGSSEESRKNSDFVPQYPDCSTSASYFSHYPNNRPLIKKRLYMSEPDRSYPRAAAASRGIGTLTSYSPGTGGFGSPATEGMRRVSSAHRSTPGSTQGRRMAAETPGKTAPYSNASSDAKYKGQNGDYLPTSMAAASRPAHGNAQYGAPTNTFTVRPGTRQPISYVYQNSHR